MMLRIRRTMSFALVLCAAASASADAQFGGLKKIKDKIEQNDVPGPVPVTATVEWLYEDTGAPTVIGMDSARATGTHRGNVRIQFGVEPAALPGGQLSKAVESSGQSYTIVVDGNANASSATIASATGSASIEGNYTEYGKKDCRAASGVSAGMFESNPKKKAETARENFDKKNVALNIMFKGEKPVGAVLRLDRPTSLTSTTTSACEAAASSKVEMAMPTPFFNTATPAGWTFETTQSGRKYTVIGKMAGVSKGELAQGTQTTRRILKLTWEAPPAPDAGAPPTKMAEAPRLESGKGTITFTQNGKQATWPMNSLVTVAGPMAGVTLMFTPDGGQPSDERGMLGLTVLNIMGRTMIAVNLAKGPGGDETFEADQCTGESTNVGGKMQGSGECKNGNRVMKFTFSGSK